MDRETARQEVKARVSCTTFLTKSAGGMYCCPFCGSGTGAHKTGAVKYYPETNTVCCFAGCEKKSYDVIDLYIKDKENNGLSCDYNEALSELAGLIGIGIDEYIPQSTKKTDGAAVTSEPGRKKDPENAENPSILPQNRADDEKGINVHPNSQNATQGRTEGERGISDYTDYYKECRRRLDDPRAASYLSARGISKATAAAYWIGFDPEFRSRAAVERAKEAGKNPPPATPRIIIPTSKESYIARAIDQGAKIRYLNEGTQGIFNEKALLAQEVKEIFVTEGAFDALSFLEAGFPAVALNSTSNAGAFIDKLEKKKPRAKLILCMDGDEAGQKAAATLAAGLNRLNIPFTLADKAILNGHKDANEALCANREAFVDAVTRQRELTARPDGVANYITGMMGGDLQAFRAEIKTGYRNLDEKSGGLYPGLYVLGAISSLGKTTFIHQMADQMAAAGQDVIFFSLEQSRLELVTKSIARRTAQADIIRAVTSLAIRKGCNFTNVQKAAKEYAAQVGNRLSIVEQNLDGGISYITNYVRRYIEDNGDTDAGKHPVIIIDYLQILQPEKTEGGQAQSMRATIDSTVTALKRLSRELSITVIVISSFNRSNYLSTVDFESFKESGGIEYTADVVFGMQLQCMNEETFNKAGDNLKDKREKVRAAKAADPRRVELVCLKNRYGVSSYSCNFDYYPSFDLFKPGTEKAETGSRARDFSNAKRV